jgi:hypothetical protein
MPQTHFRVTLAAEILLWIPWRSKRFLPYSSAGNEKLNPAGGALAWVID